MITTISVWNLLQNPKLLKQVQAGTQSVTWKFSEDKWESEYV